MSKEKSFPFMLLRSSRANRHFTSLHNTDCSSFENESKYRCPRCQTKTCSLPCTQKHKQRAACNGIRNPAEYLKRSQLATPAGIDRDYNYLKGVERSIDVANREREERGVDVVEKAATKSIARARHPDSLLHKYYVENRIDVRPAPTGMSRQKMNKTRSTKYVFHFQRFCEDQLLMIFSRRRQLFWTVEWIDADGTQYISDRGHENGTIVELYSLQKTEQRNAMKRKPGEHRKETQKRRRTEREAIPNEESSITKAESKASLEPGGGAASILTVPDAHDKDGTPVKMDDRIITQPIVDQGQQDDTANAPPDIEEDVDPSLHFYLLRPNTSSKEKVLIALNRKATLTSCLRDRTLLEFPTIYVLPHDSTSLPDGYMLEKQYLELQKSEKEELKEAVAKAEKQGAFDHARTAEASAKPGGQLDANSILNVLRRDMTR